MKIVNMKCAPIIGYQSSKIKNIARKLAYSYNESIDLIDNKLFLGFKLKNIPELKNATASFNFEENLLEINISKQTKIIIPSRRASEHTICRLFEFSSINSYDKKTHVLIERKLNKYNLVETRTGKGQASSWLADKVSSGIASAKGIVFSNVDLKNSETIEELSKNINDNIKSILDFEPGHENVVDAISNFVKTGNVSEINNLYEIIFDNSLKSKFAKDVNKKVTEKFTDSIGEVDAEKEILDSEIDQLIADAYNADKSLIKTRIKEDSFSEYLSKTFTYIGNGVSMFIDAVKAIIATIIAWEFSFEGVSNSIMNAGSYIIGKFFDLIHYLIGPSTQDKEMAEMLTKSQDWQDRFVGWINKGVQKVQILTQWSVEQLNDLQTIVNKKLQSIVEPLANTSTGKMIGGTILAIVVVYTIIKIYSIIKNGSRIFDLHQTKGGDAFASFSIQNLTSKAGFDKVFVTEAILGIISQNVEITIKNGQLTKEEELRLKKLNHVIYNTSKKKCKEGIKFFVKNIDKYISEVEDKFNDQQQEAQGSAGQES